MDSIQIIYPPNIDEDYLQDLLHKASKPPKVEPNLTFDDPIITKIAHEMMNEHNKMYRSLMEEISDILDEDYR